MIESGSRLVHSPSARRRELARRLSMAAAGCLLLILLIEAVSSSTFQQRARSAAVDDLNTLRVQLQQVMNLDVQMIRGMAGYIRTNPEISQSEFKLIAQDMLQGASDHVRNLGLARDLVITHIHPLEGNEAALGLDYRKTPDQWIAVQQALAENKTIVAGPVELKQGGLGLIARYPIYLRPDASGTVNLWGVASTVIDLERLLAHAGYPEFAATYRLALTGYNGNSSDPRIFWGDPEIRQSKPVELAIRIVNGEWRLLAAPKGGWTTLSPYLPLTLVFGVLLFAGISALIWMRYRITLDRDEFYRQLVMAAREAEAANTAKSNFVAVMSHELRTPLNAIIGFSQLLVESEDGSPLWKRARSYLSDIERSGQFLLSIINDSLDLSRIERGRYELKPEPIDVVDQVHRIGRYLAVGFEERKIALTLPPADQRAPAFADPRAFQQVMMNLLSNAHKHNPPNTSVAVSVRAVNQDLVQVEVSDTGVGIPSDKLPNIWDPFVQVESTYSRSSGGTGLGLTICQGLMNAMRGAIEIESIRGTGTTVRCTLPVRPEETTVAVPASAA